MTHLPHRMRTAIQVYQKGVPVTKSHLPGMAKTYTVPEQRTDLTLEQQALLDFVAQQPPTQAEMFASTSNTTYAVKKVLTEIKKMKLIVHKQEVIVGRGQHFGENRYHLTELGARLAVPAGSK